MATLLQYEFIALVCGMDVTVPQQRQNVIHCISENGWLDSQAMRHVTDQSASTVVAAQNFIRQNLIGTLCTARLKYGNHK